MKQLFTLTVDESHSAEVKDLTLRRDAGVFTLKAGRLFLCKPVNGRVVAMVFTGEGNFLMVPPLEAERKQLYRFYEQDSINMEFRSLFIMFADSTLDELSRVLTFRNAPSNVEVRADLDYCKRFLGREDQKYYHSGFMYTFLHGLTNELFYAHMAKKRLDPYFFEVNPFYEEEISFSQRREGGSYAYLRELVSSFRSIAQQQGSVNPKEPQVYHLKVSNYAIDAHIEDNLDFSAATALTLASARDSLRWLNFWLNPELEVDSAFWNGTAPARFVRGKESSTLWVEADHPLARGEVCSLTLHYHGDLLERDELSWVTIRGSTSWYPIHEPRGYATFDLDFHTPKTMKFICVGTQERYEEEGDVVSSRWRVTRPIRKASFNIGFFDETVPEIPIPGSPEAPDMLSFPKVVVYNAQTGHAEIARAAATYGVVTWEGMEKDIATDIVNSVKFYQKVFGPCPVDELHATEIPGFHGEAFPGLLHLTWLTYQVHLRMGSELFRAHEVAHQWWGIGVDFKTYHDQWLSEGFAHYSGLWYQQAVLKDNTKFFDALDGWRKEIMNNRKYIFGRGQEAGPIWLGARTNSTKSIGDYDLIVYKKGAWVLHMLRNLMLDLKTMNEDKFTNLMKDWYRTYRGKRASTEDFQRMVSKHVGTDMSWFFNQWVMDTRIPEYSFSYKTELTPEGKYKVRCRVLQEGVPKEFRMYVPILIKFGDDRFVRLRVTVSGDEPEFELPLLPLKPQEIVFNDLSSVLCEVKYTGGN